MTWTTYGLEILEELVADTLVIQVVSLFVRPLMAAFAYATRTDANVALEQRPFT